MNYDPVSIVMAVAGMAWSAWMVYGITKLHGMYEARFKRERDETVESLQREVESLARQLAVAESKVPPEPDAVLGPEARDAVEDYVKHRYKKPVSWGTPPPFAQPVDISVEDER